MGPAQCDRMDEEPPISLTKGLDILHHHCYSLLALLGVGDLCELRIFQQYQQDILDDSAIGAIIPVRHSLDPNL